MRRALALVAGVAAALALPSGASAHAILLGASPATQSNVPDAPAEIALMFNQSVTASARSIEVLAEDGSVLSGAARAIEGGRRVVAPVAALAAGSSYTVRWRVIGRDGHSPAGVYTFGIGVSPPPPTEAVGARGTTWKDDLARWLLFASLALLLGPLAVRLLVLRGPVPAALERRFHLVTTVAAMAVLNAGIAAFVIRASNGLQLPLEDLLYGDLQPFAEKTRFGVAFLVMTLGFGVVATLLMLAWVFDLAAPRWAALGLSALLVAGLSLAGHQATEPNASRASELADWLHLVAACIWVGGVATLALLVWPAAPALRAKAFIGFSRIAVALVGAMVLAGAYLALQRLPALSDLWETSYGRVLAVKLAVVGLAFAWGGVHHTFVRPRLEAGADVRARPSLVGETVVALTVLLAAAVLTNVAPPPVEESSTPAAAAGPG